MLGYISSTRKKSCFACVKAKRRCDLGYPFCKRCCLKGYDCKYPNATPQDAASSARRAGHVPAEVVIRHATPDLTTPPLASDADSAANIPSSSAPFINFSADDARIDPFLFQTSDSSGSSSSPESFNDFQTYHDWVVEKPREMPRTMPRTPLTRMLVPENTCPSFLTDAQVVFIVRNMSAFVTTMADSGTTSFLHQNLYQSHEPQAYQDCVAISALYLNKTVRNQRILARAIGAKIASMAADAKTWTLPQHLAAVQAMIIYQIIRLFDPDLNLQQEAERHNNLLQIWSAELWKRAFEEPQTFESNHASWVFNESLRRTVMMSVFVRCGWSCLTRGGYADQVPVLARLPLTKDLDAWDCAQEDWNLRPVGFLGEEDMLMSYGDMAGSWSHDKRVEKLDPFGKMLLAACRGKDDPRLLS
ncbi:hypothetical protein DE146DRAFT_436125 [Phaeosphaeria sp. MPI-PUGE-AT-0046c]|nr:hypothetical protein DE146DRAFT_436125 [Phaeosphaeria sp. MPI-PUGE-AT-0046c]